MKKLLGRPGVDGMVILKWYYGSRYNEIGLNSLRIWSIGGFCEHVHKELIYKYCSVIIINKELHMRQPPNNFLQDLFISVIQ
jgi:hypothetical protein